jgi:hypothetical protein
MMTAVFIFCGGSRDGQKVEGSAAKRYQFLTDDGKLGARFRELSDESQKRRRDLLSPRELREKRQRAFDEAMRDPRLLAMLKIISNKPHVSDSTLEQSFAQALSDAYRRFGIDKRPDFTQAEIAQLQQELAALSVHEIYEVTQSTEKEGDVIVQLTYFGDGDTHKTLTC